MTTINTISDAHLAERFQSFGDAIIFFHKELCPHCKNMEKVLLKFSTKAPAVEICSVDSEKHPELLQELGFERVPTLVFIRGGKVAKIQSGIMNPRELAALHASI
jgi:thioredoxin 1